MEKIIGIFLAVLLSVCTVSCTGNPSDKSGGITTLEVAALESAYGRECWENVCKSFEKVYGNITVKLTIDKNIEDVIGARMKSGDHPDVVYLATGRPAGLTETMIKEELLYDISDAFTMKIPGEDKTAEEKMISNFTSTAATNPYKDNKTYLAPVFYSPCGLFYNAGLFKERKWSVPATWDEMWELGDIASSEGIALFTYPTAGYMDSLMYALLAESGGSEFFDKCMNYDEGIWDSEPAKTAFATAAKLLSYTEKTTVANANNENYLKNQQLIPDNKALFMPNGTWVEGEMKDAVRDENFEWGFMPLPSYDGGERYSYTYFEQVWVPSAAKNKDAATAFIAYLYSDAAIEEFAKAGAAQPIIGIADRLPEEKQIYYSMYDNGALPIMGQFAATEAVEGVSMSTSLFDTVNSVVNGDKSVDEWRARVSETSDKLREALIK